MNVRKVLTRIERDSDSVLLLFDDNTIIKYEAFARDEEFPSIEQVEPSQKDLFQLGVLNREELEAHRTEEQKRLEAEQADNRLIRAWQTYAEYGEAGGFAEPIRYPAEVVKQALKIAWYTSKRNRLISYADVIFCIECPKELL